MADANPERQLKARLKERPELLFLPLVFLVVALGWFISGPSWFSKLLQYLLSPNPDPSYAPVHFVTFTAAWISFGISLWKCRGLTFKQNALLSASVPFGGTGLFEIIYQALGKLSQPAAFQATALQWTGVVAWAALGLVAVPYWQITKAFYGVLAGTIVGFLAWFVIGYPQVTWGTMFQQPTAYLLNSALKLTCILLFLVPIKPPKAQQLRGYPKQAKPISRNFRAFPINRELHVTIRRG